jgi:hypothetical protein
MILNIHFAANVPPILPPLLLYHPGRPKHFPSLLVAGLGKQDKRKEF